MGDPWNVLKRWGQILKFLNYKYFETKWAGINKDRIVCALMHWNYEIVGLFYTWSTLGIEHYGIF